MSLSVFDGKIFNAEVFKGYVDRLPNPKKNELIKCKAIRPRPDLAQAMADGGGGNYLTTALRGLINNSEPQNYDGSTDLESDNTTTFKHSRVVVGRMKSWVENDFSYDITGGEDFLENIAQQIVEYWEEIDQGTLVSILTGVFNMTGGANAEFVKAHTYDVTNITNSEGQFGRMDGTTLNTCMQRACGDNKGKFSLALVHSFTATNLENLKILVYLKYNDADGMERELGIGTLNGRLVLVDDSMPVLNGYEKATADTADALKVIASGTAKAGEITLANVKKGAFFPDDIAASTEDTESFVVEAQEYVTFVLGDGAIEYTDCGAKVPYETDRNPYKNGGQDALISRQRKCWAPFGISFTMEAVAKVSPTNAELENGVNWELVSSAASGNKEYIAHKTIPIARIISRG